MSKETGYRDSKGTMIEVGDKVKFPNGQIATVVETDDGYALMQGDNIYAWIEYAANPKKHAVVVGRLL